MNKTLSKTSFNNKLCVCVYVYIHTTVMFLKELSMLTYNLMFLVGESKNSSNVRELSGIL